MFLWEQGRVAPPKMYHNYKCTVVENAAGACSEHKSSDFAAAQGWWMGLRKITQPSATDLLNLSRHCMWYCSDFQEILFSAWCGGCGVRPCLKSNKQTKHQNQYKFKEQDIKRNVFSSLCLVEWFICIFLAPTYKRTRALAWALLLLRVRQKHV